MALVICTLEGAISKKEEILEDTSSHIQSLELYLSKQLSMLRVPQSRRALKWPSFIIVRTCGKCDILPVTASDEASDSKKNTIGKTKKNPII